MTSPAPAAPILQTSQLLGIEGLSSFESTALLDLADSYVELSRQAEKKRSTLRGRTIINCFFENSTRTRTSFEVAGKRLGADVINMAVAVSSMRTGGSATTISVKAVMTRPSGQSSSCWPRPVIRRHCKWGWDYRNRA